MISWTQEELTTLQSMRHSGKSAGVIADVLGKTRNAVAGKLHRLGLCKPRRKAENRAVMNGHKSVSVRFGAFALASPRGNGDINKNDPAKPLGVTLIDLQPNDCRWPYGEEHFLFCGHGKAPGSAYCFTHSQMAWRRRNEPA